MKQYFKIGKFAASHGLAGHLVLAHSLGSKTVLKDVQAVFLEDTKDNFIPYFVENVSPKNSQELFVKVEGVDTKEAARRLTPKEVWLTAEDFTKHAAKASPISLLGFDLVDRENNLGEIIEVIEQPHQILCTVLYKGKEAMIPIHDSNLLKMDQKNRKVYVEVPDGLLEIYE